MVDAHGRKLSKSLDALPVDASDPMPALRAAWQALGQVDMPNVRSVAAMLDAAREAFDPARIPLDAVEAGLDVIALARDRVI